MSSQQRLAQVKTVPEKSHNAPHESTTLNAFFLVSAALIVGVLNYALNIVLGWTLSKEQYGQVGVSQTLIFICSWFLAAGFPWVVTRAIAQARGAEPNDGGEGTEAWRIYKTALIANSALTFCLVGLLLLSFALGWLPLDSSYGLLIVIVALTIGSLGVGAVPSAGLQGLFRFGRISAVRIVEAVSNIVASVALVLLGFGAAGALGGFTVAAILATVLQIWFMRDKPFWRAQGWGGLATVRAALPLTVAVFGGVLLTNIDLLALKFLSAPLGSDALSGEYQVAAVLARAPFFVGTALVSVFYPEIARDRALTDEERSSGQLLRWIMLGALPINVIMAAGAPVIVSFFFPERYISSALTLTILAVSSAFLVLASALTAILQASNQVKVPAVVMSLAVAIDVLGLVVLVPPFGPTGAAVASLTASTMACAVLVFYRWRLGLGLPTLGRQIAALVWLALLILPLGLLDLRLSRVLVALWVSASLMLYIALCFVLNLVSAHALTPNPPRQGPIASIVRHLLSAGEALNRVGKRMIKES